MLQCVYMSSKTASLMSSRGLNERLSMIETLSKWRRWLSTLC